MAPSEPQLTAAAWALGCSRCETTLAAHDHVEFLQENERSAHLGLRRHLFDELQECVDTAERTLRSKCAAAAHTFTKLRQTHAKKCARSPFTLLCPSCQVKIGSELILDGWVQPEYLFDAKACHVTVHRSGGDHRPHASELVAFKKFPELLRSLQEKQLDLRVRNPTSPLACDNEDDEPATRPPKRTKTREPPPPPMVWPTVNNVRACLAQENAHSKLSTLRDYQMELLLGALLENTIVYLPTGCGKTLVAVRAISILKQLNPDRKAVFLVPTGPLVSQQTAYVRRESDLRVVELSGQHSVPLNPTTRREMLKTADVLVATPQYFVNRLFDQEVRMDQFCVVVFDEAHHATGVHPYCDVLTQVALLKHECRPRIVALTASPFGERVTTLDPRGDMGTLSKLCVVYNAKLNTPTLGDGSLKLESVFKHVDWVCVEQSPQSVRLRQAIRRHVKAVNGALQSLAVDGASLYLGDALLCGDDDGGEDDCDEEVYILCGRLRKFKANLCGDDTASSADPRKMGAADLLRHMRRMLMVLPKLSVHGPAYMADMLCAYFCRMEATEPRLHKLVQPVYQRQFEAVLEELKAAPLPSSGQLTDEVAAKVHQVAQIVEGSGIDRSARAIVFVRRRKMALWLAQVMEKIPTLKALNPTRFIGHNSYEGMSWEAEQRPTLDRFRRGIIRMLVATSVLEEGLDVPECSLVIQFDGVVGMTSLVQSRGRARQARGRFVVMSGQKRREELQDLIRSELTLFEIARVEAEALESKAATRELMDELAACGTLAVDDPAEATAVAVTEDQHETDWSRMESKFCVTFGLMTSDARGDSDRDRHAILGAISDSGIVEVDRFDPKQGLAALEVPGGGARANDYSALYEELCERLDFRIEQADEMTQAPRCSPYWMKLLSAPSPPPTADDIATFQGAVLVEEPADEFLRCVRFVRGRFVERGTFEPEEAIDCSASATSFTKSSQFLVMQGYNDLRFEFDLCSIHDRVVWIETTSTSAWVLYMTVRHAPKIWGATTSTRVCPDFDMKALTFAFHLESTSKFVMRLLRKQLTDADLNIRDTKVDVARRAAAPVSMPSIRELSSEPTMLTAALLALLSSCCFIFGARLPEVFLQKVRNLKTDALRIQALLRFEPVAGTEIEFVSEFRAFIQGNHPSLEGLARLAQPLVLKVIVTPTRILFERADIAPPNRVLRHFGSENFLYVYFRDENRERVDFGDAVLAKRVRDVLNAGIKIGASHFRFLGCSLSQLRNASCVFTVLDPVEVREWVGEFQRITTPAKYFKRLGQSLSSTRETITIHPSVLLHAAKDIVDAQNQFVFTDGCGEITTNAAQKVARILGLPKTPSAFQIRLGGAKGVLVVSDFQALETNPEDDELADAGHRGVRLRESMVKFQSPHNMLEIVALASGHSVAYLTRQSILILSALGIPDATFMGLQDEYIASLATMVVSSTLGLQEVRSAVPFEQSWCIDVLYGRATTASSLKMDPYHRRIIHAMYEYKLANTVLRARIPVAKGRNLMGVADFTGTLDYGEVFVQYTERGPSGREDLDRVVILNDVNVLVHRSPCHHPGDLRVLRCRRGGTVPDSLRQLRDCIVFPTRGPRPHPDECTGGDLDGDIFTVIWDERLIPPPQNVMPAMVLTEGPANPTSAGDETAVDVPALVEFYLFALKHDILGIASNAHLAVSDADLKYGCFASDALVLAEICAREVDCCKNPKHLDVVRELTPKQYPDFMGNTEKPSYKSPKVLGKMYRRALALQMHTAPNFGGAKANEVDESFLTQGYAKHVPQARVIYHEYKHTVRMLLQSCGAVSEAELATGMIIEPASEYKADYFRFGERSRDAFYSTQKLFRDQFLRVYKGRSARVRSRVAAAWYAVAYGDMSDDRLLSFAWILADVLIANRDTRSGGDELESGDGVALSVLDMTAEAMRAVACQLQLSILSEIGNRQGSLLVEFHDRLRALTSLRIALEPHFGTREIGCVLFGSSALLTFEPQSDLDVVLEPVADVVHLKALARFADSAAEGIADVKMRERTHVPVLSLSLDETWTMEISSARNGPIKTAWFREYMVAHPFFWPAAYVLIQWGKAAGLIRRRCIDGAGSSGGSLLPVGFLWLFVDFCLQKHFVQPIECPPHGLDPVDNEVEMAFWTSLLARSVHSAAEPTAATVMLAFFACYGDVKTPQAAYAFTDPLDPKNDTQLTPEHAETFREQCYAAHHQLCVASGDVASLLLHQRDNRRRITLSRALSRHVHRSPEFYATKILRDAGVASGAATLSFERHSNALRPDLYMANVDGDGESVRRIEQKIEKIEEELGAPQVHRPTEGVHRSGCCLLLFEGATSQSEHVAFQNYFGARHAQHEHLELHQVHLVSFMNGLAWLESAIMSFTTKFLRQMVKLTHYEKLNPGVTTPKAIVRFGHHYLINLPWSFHEEAIALATVEMLEREFERGREARELYESVLVARQRDRKTYQAAGDGEDNDGEMGRAEEETRAPGGGGGGFGSGGSARDEDESGKRENGQGQRRVTALSLHKATAMTRSDRGVAHSFYPMIDASLAPHLDDFAAQRKRMRVTAQSESFQVSIVRDALEFNVRLTPELQLEKVKTRANRWLSATLKMRQELSDDGSRMDATPDVRYYVSASEDVPSSDPLPQLLARACATARGGCGVLQFVPQAAEPTSGGERRPRVRVSSELLGEGIQLKEIVNVRHMRCTTYQSPTDGVKMRVQRVREYSFPTDDGFVRVTPKTEVELVMPPLSPAARVDASFARRFVLAGVELVAFLREHVCHGIGEMTEME